MRGGFPRQRRVRERELVDRGVVVCGFVGSEHRHESGRVVVLDDGGRPAVVNCNLEVDSRPAVFNRSLVMLCTWLPSRRRGSANGAHNLSVSPVSYGHHGR